MSAPRMQSLFKFARGGLPAFASPLFSWRRKSITAAMSRGAIRTNCFVILSGFSPFCSRRVPADRGEDRAAELVLELRGEFGEILSASLVAVQQHHDRGVLALFARVVGRREFHFVLAGVVLRLEGDLLGAEIFLVFIRGSRLGGLPAVVLPVDRASAGQQRDRGHRRDPRPNAPPKPPPKNRIKLLHRHGPRPRRKDVLRGKGRLPRGDSIVIQANQRVNSTRPSRPGRRRRGSRKSRSAWQSGTPRRR